MQGEISNQLLWKRGMDEQSVRLPLRKTRKIRFELIGFADWKRFYFDIARLSCDPHMFQQSGAEKRRGVHEHCNPPQRRPRRNAAVANGIPSDDAPLRNPMTGIADCCARAARGHVAA